MKGEHCDACMGLEPECLCNTCKRDPGTGDIPCCDRELLCPIKNCPDYEPDDEEDYHA